MTNLEVIDWQLATRLAGKMEVAKELLALLLSTLPDDLRAINESYLAQNYSQMQKQVHKLHGALCYCGLPRIKNVVEQLESQLKNHIMDSLSFLLDQLNIEVTLLLKHCSTHSLESCNSSAA